MKIGNPIPIGMGGDIINMLTKEKKDEILSHLKMGSLGNAITAFRLFIESMGTYDYNPSLKKAEVEIKIRAAKPYERWTKKCGTCDLNFVPDEYELCDWCIQKLYGLTERFDSCDGECLGPGNFETEEVMRAIRHLRGETYVQF